VPFPNKDSQFKPGQSGNPGGRPKQTVSSRLRELLEEPKLKRGKRGKTLRDQVAETIIRQALFADHRFTETLLDRTEGKVPQAIQLPTQDLESAREKLRQNRANVANAPHREPVPDE
jgi:hypothetical protein